MFLSCNGVSLSLSLSLCVCVYDLCVLVVCLSVAACVKKTSVGDLLCRVARELRADAIFLGARVRWQLTRILFGSVASYTRNHANCPVLQCSTA